jgi:ectoine hydroxylase-related dioxygenase (phytanoyl-CoA dioxygenase family)
VSEVETATHNLIEGEGYHLLKSVIDTETAATVRQYVLDHLDDGVTNAPGDINLVNLLNRDELFRSLVTQPRILAVAHALLGRDARLAAYTAKVLMPGCSPGRIHVDYPYWAMDPGMPVKPALMMQVIWMMEPFSAENGGTWVVPGSQKRTNRVEVDQFRQEAVQMEGEAGDALISHGLLWHQTAINHADEPRVALLINFSQLSIQPMRELGPFSDEFLESASDELQALLPANYSKALMNRLKRDY